MLSNALTPCPCPRLSAASSCPGEPCGSSSSSSCSDAAARWERRLARQRHPGGAGRRLLQPAVPLSCLVVLHLTLPRHSPLRHPHFSVCPHQHLCHLPHPPPGHPPPQHLTLHTPHQPTRPPLPATCPKARAGALGRILPFIHPLIISVRSGVPLPRSPLDPAFLSSQLILRCRISMPNTFPLPQPAPRAPTTEARFSSQHLMSPEQPRFPAAPMHLLSGTTLSLLLRHPPSL